MRMGSLGAEAPRFSILLPTHNRDDILPYAIQSVFAQTIQDFEVLIVGDGCTDRTAEVVAGFDDPRIRWFDLPKGPHFGYANRNVALRTARGGLIAFMAHDDIWLPDHLALLERHFANPAVELAYSRPLWVAPDGLITPTAFNLHDRAVLEAFLHRQENHIPASCVVHRRACLAKYGFWDEALPRMGDWDMWARIIKGGKPHNFAYEPVPTSLHFRAIWKTEATAGVPEIHIWNELRRRGMLPATTPSTPVEPGIPEQESAWRALAADPDRWTRSLRDSVHQALDQCVAQAHLLLASEEKDRHIGNLDVLISLKDQHISNLDQLVAAKEREIALLQELAGTRDQRVGQCAQILAERDQRIVGLEHLLADKERHINRIEGRLPIRLYRRLHRLAQMRPVARKRE